MRLGIRSKLLIFAALVWAVIFGAYSVYIYKERIEQTRRMALNTASYLSREIIADKQFYTATVVSRALESGMVVADNYHNIESSIPLPATFIKEVSRSLGAKGGYEMALISRDPVNPASAPSDDFQQEALDALYGGGTSRYYSFEKHRGKEAVRYMVPDIATSRTCVDCHNTNPASPRTDYRIGDVVGGLEVIVPIESELKVAMADIWRAIGFGFVVIVGMGIAGLIFIRRVVTSPLTDILDTTTHVASGDLSVVSSVKSDDEIGDLAQETNRVVGSLHTMIEEMRSHSSEAAAISENIKRLTARVLDGSRKQGSSLESMGDTVEHLDAFMNDVARSTESLSESLKRGSASVVELGAHINDVVDNMESLFSSVDETAESTRDMTFSIRETSENIENLSGAVMQVSSSMVHINARIKEVEANAGEAARFAEEVIRDARTGMESVEKTKQGIVRTRDITGESSEIIESLRGRIREIGKILDVIGDVAEETNLLALNAAIIAAQSGEHGKSFAVVANEIKDLAERTSTSAKEVSEILQAVQTESVKAGRAMGRGLESAEEGVRLSVEAGEGLRKIVDSAQRSNTSVKEIARASADQTRESRMVAESTEKVAEMARRIVSATQEQARGSELINRASERMAEISYKVRSSAWAQVESNKQITEVMEDVQDLVTHIESVVREQTRNTAKVLEAVAAVRGISLDNVEKSVDTDRAVERMAGLNQALLESVRKFKLKR